MIHFFDGPLRFANTRGGMRERVGKPFLLNKKILKASVMLTGLEMRKKNTRTNSNELNVEVWAEILNGNCAVVHGKPTPITDTKCERFSGTVRYTLMVMTED